MTPTMDEDFEHRNLIQIKPFLKSKRVGSQEKEICETIIRYLYERNYKVNNDPSISDEERAKIEKERVDKLVESQGYVMVIDVLGACTEHGIPRRAIERCLTDLENHRIIDKRRYLYPAKRRRPGPEKKRENVFYRLCLAYAGQQNWEKNYSDLLESFVKDSDKMNVSIWLLENLKKTSTPADFDEAVKATERSLGIKKHADTTESTSKDIIKSMVNGWGDVFKNAPIDPRHRTTDDILKSILDNRSKINADRAVQHKADKEKKEDDNRKLRNELKVNFHKNRF